MDTLGEEIETIARMLLQGQVGDANSRWNRQLGNLSQALHALPAQAQTAYLPALRQILACQQNEDWVGMSDGLRHALAPLLRHLDS